MKTEDIIAIKIRRGRSRCFNRVIKIAETTTITDIIFDDPLKERLIKKEIIARNIRNIGRKQDITILIAAHTQTIRLFRTCKFTGITYFSLIKDIKARLTKRRLEKVLRDLL